MNTSATASVAPRAKPSARPPWMLSIVIAGYFLPAAVGIVVWMYLRSIGKPVMPVEWIVQMIPALCIFSAFWVLPFLAVYLAARFVAFTNKKYAGMIYGAFLGTTLAELLVFGMAWTNGEIVVMGFLFLPVAVFVGTLLGAAIGFLFGWMLQKKTLPSAESPSPTRPS